MYSKILISITKDETILLFKFISENVEKLNDMNYWFVKFQGYYYTGKLIEK